MLTIVRTVTMFLTMPNLIHMAIPAFILLMVVEAIASSIQDNQTYELKDTAASLSMGIGNVVLKLGWKGVVYGVYVWAYSFRIFELPNTWWVWLLLIFAEDFTYYFSHRISHECRFFWASHVNHHSSERYNLSTALRQTWTGVFTGSWWHLWLMVVGFHPLMVMTMQAISLLYQFWIHTETIGRLGPLEWVFNTPSHHRVHHGSDLKYLDRNHGGILIIWDKLFGTFQPEEHLPKYGLTTNINSFNPVKIALHEWQSIWKDVSTVPGAMNKLKYLFYAPGWSHDGSSQTVKQRRKEAGIS